MSLLKTLTKDLLCHFGLVGIPTAPQSRRGHYLPLIPLNHQFAFHTHRVVFFCCWPAPRSSKSSHQDQWRVSSQLDTQTVCCPHSSLPPLLTVIISSWSLQLSGQCPSELTADLSSSSLCPPYLLWVLSAPVAPGSGWALDPPPIHHAVSVGQQLDEVWTGRPGLSGLVAWTLGSALHWQTGNGEFIHIWRD